MTTTERLKALQLASMLWSMMMLGFKCSKVPQVLGLWKQQEALQSSPLLVGTTTRSSATRNAILGFQAESKSRLSSAGMLLSSVDASNPGIEMEDVDPKARSTLECM